MKPEIEKAINLRDDFIQLLLDELAKINKPANLQTILKVSQIFNEIKQADIKIDMESKEK